MPEPRESAVPPHHQIHAALKGRRPDHVLGALAAAQHGVVARRQLLDAGLTAEMVRTRIEGGRLLPLHRGVYAAGHRRLRREGFWLAGVLAAGPGAVLSHREAAALHGLRPAERASVDVTVAAQRKIAGITVHRVARLAPEDVTTLDAVPVTTVARTLVDLAAVVPPAALRKALEEAERSNRLDMGTIEAALGRTRGRNGSGHERITRALAELASTGTTMTRSALEDRFLSLVAAGGLPRPSINVTVEGIEVDATWPAARLAVELDGWDYHRTRDAFQRDRERSNDLQAAGWTVLRFTHADVMRRPTQTATRIGRVLAQAATATV